MSKTYTIEQIERAALDSLDATKEDNPDWDKFVSELTKPGKPEEREFWLAKGEFPFYEGYPVDSGCKPNARAYDKVIKVREILE